MGALRLPEKKQHSINNITIRFRETFMRTNDFTAPVTSKALNESMFKKFGVKVNFENYERSELENYRNLLRTKLHQEEVKSNFNALLNNESYQKDKHMLDLLNARIKEMLGEGKKVDKFVKAVEKSEKATGKSAKKAKDIAWATANKKGMLDNKNKKKVKEGKASAAEMAHAHAMEYAKHHARGNLEMAQHHREACEGCGGKITHGAGGKTFHQHSGVNNGAAYECMEGTMGAGIGAGLGALAAGPVGAVVCGALYKKPVNSFNVSLLSFINYSYCFVQE